MTPGFTENAGPYGINTGPDGHIWFLESESPGAIARVNDDGTVTELTAGVTSGFSKDNEPEQITTGPDGHLWFTEYGNSGIAPGRIARVNDDGTVSEFASGVTPGFSAGAGPTGITSGPDGRIWFAEYDRGGIGRITVGPGVSTGAASSLGTTSVTPAGRVRPNGQQTVYRFEYGPSPAYGSQTGLIPAGSEVAPVAASAAIPGLQPGTLYHYRLVATNDTDTTIGEDRMFTTAPVSTGGTVNDSRAPSAPGGLRGRYMRASLLLDWRPASDDVGVARYQLFRDGAPRSTVPGSSTRLALALGRPVRCLARREGRQPIHRKRGWHAVRGVERIRRWPLSDLRHAA